MSKLDKMLDTIRNLRKKAANTASSEAEAMAAIEMADRLMAKNGITLDDLKESASKGGIVTDKWGGATSVMHPVQYVATAIASLTETRTWLSYSPAGKQVLNFIGFEADVEYAMYLTDLVHNAMEKEWNEFRDSGDYQLMARNLRGRARSDFMRAMAHRIRQKMLAMVTEKAANPSGLIQSNALVVAKRTMVTEALAETVGQLRSPRQRKKKYLSSAMHAGLAAGDRTTITTGIHAA